MYRIFYYKTSNEFAKKHGLENDYNTINNLFKDSVIYYDDVYFYIEYLGVIQLEKFLTNKMFKFYYPQFRFLNNK